MKDRIFPAAAGWLAAVALLLTGCSTTPTDRTTSADTRSAAVEVQKSPNDNRSYRYLVLDNDLRVLLVEDPDTDKAAASLTVLRGSYHEPEAYPGLAHFLEHMLFIGTGKYPEVDGYQQFIAAHGGSSNAYTAAEVTNYFFDIQPEHFSEGMDRFSQFFVSPLLDPAYVDREKNAVHSEYQLQIKDDGWRGLSATRAAMNPAYPGARFNIGSLETLGDGVDEALVEFFESAYSADQMVLVALSNEPLDELEAWVTPMFEAIENRGIGPAPITTRAFTDAQLPSVLSYQTFKDEHTLAFNFPIPAPDVYYRKKPVQYLTNLLGHEGVGSLHHLLKARGWIESLGAGTSRLDETNAYISVNMTLTDSGRDAIEDITAAFFTYVDLLSRNEPEDWRYREQAVIADLAFRYQEKSSATAFVYQTAPNLALYPPEDVLAAPFLMEEFDPTLIKRYLRYLTPDNLFATVSGPDVVTEAIEPWFSVPYTLERRKLASHDVDAAEIAELALPEPNRFLPDNLVLLDTTDALPHRALSEPGLEIWLATDTEFGVPRANQYFTLGLAGGHGSARDVAMAQLYRRLVADSLNDYTYPALLAGLRYSLSAVPGGFQLGLSGYSEKQIELLDTVLERFTSLQIDPDRFAISKRELEREWRNFSNERPYTQTYSALTNLLVSSSWSPEDLASALADVTQEELESWRRSRFDRFAVVGLAHGNVDQASVDAAAGQLADRLPSPTCRSACRRWWWSTGLTCSKCRWITTTPRWRCTFRTAKLPSSSGHTARWRRRFCVSSTSRACVPISSSATWSPSPTARCAIAAGLRSSSSHRWLHQKPSSRPPSTS